MEKKIRINLGSTPDTGEIARFVQIANKFRSTVYIVLNDTHTINAKSIMGMMSLLSKNGQEVTVEGHGEDEEKAVEMIAACLMGKE